MVQQRIPQEPGEILDVPPGARAVFRLPVTRRSSGEELAIAVHVAAGKQSGPVLGLTGAIHGDALYGSHIIRLAMERLDLARLRGTVIGVPVCNPVAFESGTRTTGQGWNTDMNNMNRVFPGQAGGWVTQKMAAALTKFVVPHIDALIDYHCGADTSINYTLVNGDETEEQRRVFNFARLMGTDFIYVHDADPFSGTIDQYVKSLGKLCVVAEQGGNLMPAGFDSLSLLRIDNFMKGLGMQDGEPELPSTQLLMRGGRSLPRIDSGGLFYPEVGIEGLSTVVPGGTLLSRVVDPHTFETLQRIEAPYTKSALCDVRPTFGRVNPGDYAYIIGNASEGVKLERLQDWMVEV